MTKEGLHQTIAELRQSIAWMDLVLANLVEGVAVLDDQERIHYANDSFAHIIGKQRINILGMSVQNFAPDLWSQFRLQASAPGAQTYQCLRNYAMTTAEGERVFDVTLTSLLPHKQKILVFHDVTEQRKLGARMHQSEKLSAVGQLAAGVAHEINNPLGVILGFAQGMSRQTKTGDALELPIKSIEREALRCKSLVQNLLTFARTSQSDRGVIGLNEAVQQAQVLIVAQVKMSPVSLHVDLAPSLPMILGNKNQLQQVVLNLAKNALDAMPNGGTLSITTELLDDAPHSWVCLKVADTGTGIPPALMQKIFEPFFTTKPIGQGTGLGLSLISEIVQKHSGAIDVDSSPGRTVFTVKLPARTGQELEERLKSIQRDKLAAASVVPYHKR